MPTDKKNPKPYNFLGPETDRENALYRAEISGLIFNEAPEDIMKCGGKGDEGLGKEVEQCDHRVGPACLEDTNYLCKAYIIFCI